MRSILRLLFSLFVALVGVMAFRAMAFTIYNVGGEGLAPVFHAGDRVLVNRWSYGLRAGGKRFFPYTRIAKQYVQRGDVVAFNLPADSLGGTVAICRVLALPGDTVRLANEKIVVPSRRDCADADYYWMQALGENSAIDSRHIGLVPERLIIGRACLIVFSHLPFQPFWRGYPTSRMLKPIEP